MFDHVRHPRCAECHHWAAAGLRFDPSLNEVFLARGDDRHVGRIVKQCQRNVVVKVSDPPCWNREFGRVARLTLAKYNAKRIVDIGSTVPMMKRFQQKVIALAWVLRASHRAEEHYTPLGR